MHATLLTHNTFHQTRNVRGRNKIKLWEEIKLWRLTMYIDKQKDHNKNPHRTAADNAINKVY